MRTLASIKLTLFCIALLMILIFWGTLAEVQIGTFAAQKEFFDSFWIYKRMGPMKIPVFPGGHMIGALWMANLVAAFFTQFDYEKKHLGILCSHFGIIVLFGGQFLTQTFAKESQMPI